MREALGGWLALLALAYVVEDVVAALVSGVAVLLGACFGISAVRGERTPEALWEGWERRSERKKKNV